MWFRSSSLQRPKVCVVDLASAGRCCSDALRINLQAFRVGEAGERDAGRHGRGDHAPGIPIDAARGMGGLAPRPPPCSARSPGATSRRSSRSYLKAGATSVLPPEKKRGPSRPDYDARRRGGGEARRSPGPCSTTPPSTMSEPAVGSHLCTLRWRGFFCGPDPRRTTTWWSEAPLHPA